MQTRRNFLASMLAIPAAFAAAKAASPVRLDGARLDSKPRPPLNEGGYTLFWGPTRTGKTQEALRALVRHCYENKDALALIATPVWSLALHGGVWSHLEAAILPQMLADYGIEFSTTKFDFKRRPYLWVKNKYGGHSMVMCASGLGGCLLTQIRGVEPSFIFAPYLDAYFSSSEFCILASGLGRRRNFLSHYFVGEARSAHSTGDWIYKKWFVDQDPMFSRIYFPAIVGSKLSVMGGDTGLA